MTSGAPSREAPSRRRRFLRRAAWTVGVIAALVLVAWVAVPPLVKSQVESGLTALLDRPTTVGSVAFNPFKLRLTLRKLAVARGKEGDSLFSFDELAADVSPASLWHRAPVVDRLRIVRPYFWLSREDDGRYNIQDLIDALMAKPIEVPRASLNNIVIEGGTAIFVDRTTGRDHRLETLDVAIPFLSSLPYDAEIQVQPRLEGTVNGTPFALRGTSTPFAERREATLDVNVDALPLPTYVAYLPSKPRFDLTGGALTTRLQVVFAGGAGKANQLELRGEARVEGLAAKRRDGTPLASAQRITVGIERIDLLGRDIRLATATLDAPSVDVRRRADGTFEWAQLLVGGPPAAAPGRAAPPQPPAPARERRWSARVGKFVVGKGKVALVDEGSTFRSTLVDVAVDATNIATLPGEKGHVKVDFLSEDRIAAFTGEAEVEPAAPSASGRFAVSKFSLGLLFPFYQSALAVDVQKGSIDYATAFAVDAGGNLRLTGGEATATDLRLALRGDARPMWRVPKLAGTGIDVDVPKRHVAIAEVQSRGAALRVLREADGTFAMTRLVKAAEGTTAAPAAKSADAGNVADGSAWTVLVGKLALAAVALDYEDRVPQPPAKLALRELALVATDVGNTPGRPSRATLRSRIASDGRVAFSGNLVRRPLGVDGEVDLARFPVAALKPYVEPHVNVVVTEGALSAKGRLTLAVPPEGAVRVAWKGDVAISDFASLDKPTTSDLARWKTLSFDGLDVATHPFRASVARLGLDDFYARVIVYPDATLNLARLVTPGASPEPSAEAAPVPAQAAQRSALPVAIGRIEVARGNVNFTDLFVRPNYSANLTDVAGSVTTLSAEQSGEVTLTARVDHSAPVEVRGRVSPFAKELSLDLAGKARNVDLPPLSPYSGKYAGYGIEKGQLSFDVHYKVEDRKLAAENRLVLDQLQFGAKVESPTATKLPVLLAVALLKDSRGVIDIRLPISGSLDDPKFSLGGIIVQIIVNLITKAVTAPFALLSAAFGGGEELSTLPFAPGSAAIGPDAQKRIETLGKALRDRPGLKLDIAGRADPAADREALRHEAVQVAMRREKMKSLVADGNAPASVDQVAVEEAERTKWLTAAYRGAPIQDRPRNAIGMLKDLPPAEMEAMLLANAKVDDEALRALANARARAVSDALAASGVAADRLFLVAPKIGGEVAKDAAGDATGGAQSRVDLALR